jgi:hypothetical protein
VAERCSRCLQSSERNFFQGRHLKGHWTIRNSNQLYAAGLLSNTDAQSAGQAVTYYCYRCWSLGKSTTALYHSPFQVISYTWHLSSMTIGLITNTFFSIISIFDLHQIRVHSCESSKNFSSMKSTQLLGSDSARTMHL